ncbi:MAG TPA: hypothetical protein VGM23_14045 [Armatimonadota bacterium]|jgi:hypothetical protein
MSWLPAKRLMHSAGLTRNGAHYLGGVTGYDVAEHLLVLDPAAIIRVD